MPSEIAAEIPGNCKVTFAQILSRHGARDPTFFKSMAYAALLGRLKKTVTSFPDRYRFLATYSYDLGSDQLTTFGRQQMVSSGVKFYDRYQQLASHVTPFFRASGQQRVVESAEGFAKGFHASRSKDRGSGSDSYPYDILTIDEGSGSNNTLSHGLCDAFEDHKGEDQLEWLENFAALIKDRLNQGLPGANLSLSETIYLMDLCPFTTLASNEGRLSEFCDIFTETEWHGYDYFQSLGKYYGYANGNALGPTQGVGFVNELIARLTGKPVLDHTSVNHTLDRSDETFPIGGDNVLFADFSHDKYGQTYSSGGGSRLTCRSDMMAVFAALGLYNSTLPLPKSSFQNTNDTNGFSASWTVSFAARAYIEKLQCSDSDEELVRVLVNDRIIPLETCGGDSLGRCTLDSFVDSMSFARQGGKWDQCFE